MRMRQVKKQRMARKFCHNPVVDFLYSAAEEKFMILNVTHFGSCFNNFVLQLEQLPSNLRQTEHVNLYLIIPRLTNMSKYVTGSSMVTLQTNGRSYLRPEDQQKRKLVCACWRCQQTMCPGNSDISLCQVTCNVPCKMCGRTKGCRGVDKGRKCTFSSRLQSTVSGDDQTEVAE